MVPSSVEFIEKASGIKQRYVIDKAGVLDPTRMRPRFAPRPDDQLSLMAEIAVDAANKALAAAGKTGADDRRRAVRRGQHAARLPGDGLRDPAGAGCRRLRLRHERGLLVGHLRHRAGGQRGAQRQRAAACWWSTPRSPRPTWSGATATATSSSATSAPRWWWRPRTATAADRWRILGTRLVTQFSNNIRNNAGFLNRCEDTDPDARDKTFARRAARSSRKWCRWRRPTSRPPGSLGFKPAQVRRYWLHQANLGMNQLVIRKLVGGEVGDGDRAPDPDEYANTASAGSIIAFHHHHADLAAGDLGVICSFGAGYSIGGQRGGAAAIVRRWPT
jgi:beta-ketodecanoyl-[acyl-carrier-protein] synthase